MIKLRNDFSEETRALFIYNFECWVCGKNTWNAGHHILGRGLGDSNLENSPLNFAPICNETCHLNKGFNEEDKKIMLQKTIKWLFKQGYKLTKKDEKFIIKYYRYYQ